MAEPLHILVLSDRDWTHPQGGGTGTNLALENLTNVPFRATNGALDPLVNINTWRTSADALAAGGPVDYRIVLVHNRSHDGPIAEGNCFYLDLLRRPRDLNPTRVRYTVVPQAFRVDDAVGLNLRPNAAYWASKLESRDTNRASIDADSHAKQPSQPVEDLDYTDQNLTHTADFCGAHPTMRNGTSWGVEGRRLATGAGPPRTGSTSR